MTSAERAKRLYQTELIDRLEPDHQDEYVAIESDSKSYFLGTSFVEAALAARTAYPDKKPFVIRIGYDAAFHMGGAIR